LKLMEASTTLVLLGCACCVLGGVMLAAVDYRLTLAVVALWLGKCVVRGRLTSVASLMPAALLKASCLGPDDSVSLSSRVICPTRRFIPVLVRVART
jgi:hypothetical protein